jgi:hypothetical protein
MLKALSHALSHLGRHAPHTAPLFEAADERRSARVRAAGSSSFRVSGNQR